MLRKRNVFRGRSGGLMLLVLVLLAFFAGRSRAAASPDDRENSTPVAWWAISGQTDADVNAFFSANNARLVDIQLEAVAVPRRFAATYVSNTSAYAKSFWWYYDVDETTLNLLVTNNNARPISLKAYDIGGGQIRFAVVMIPNTGADAKAWWWYYNATVADLNAIAQNNNARLVQVNSYVIGGVTRYAAVLIANTGADARSWWWYVNATPIDISTFLSANQARLYDLDRDPTTGKYNAIMVGCAAGCPASWSFYDTTGQALLDNSTQEGSRVIDLNTHPGCGSTCFSYVLINNSPSLVHAVSRKIHGSAGTFDLVLAATPTNPTTEPRQSSPGGAHSVVFQFDAPVTSGTAAVTAGVGVAGAPSFSGNEMTVPITGVANAQYVTLAVSNVGSTGIGTAGVGAVRVGFLTGDVSGNRVVSLTDLLTVNSVLTQAVTAANFLRDVNVSGTLTLTDKLIVNSKLTQALPAP